MTATDGELLRLARELGAALVARRWHVACAESCTGGWIAKALTDIPGSSAWFGWGFVAYDNQAKVTMLQVAEHLLDEYGAVSEPVVRALAEGAKRVSGAELSVAGSGVAGPAGGTDDKPVGTVWLAWAGPAGTHAQVHHSAGRAPPAANLHLTLAFLGAVSAARLARVRQLSAPPVERFVLSIDTLGFRQRARLLWAAPGTVPPALLELESWLWRELAELGIPRERRAYLPHVTLARRARHVSDTLTPVRWPVAEFALVESTPGARSSVYTILETWPLT